MSLERDIRLYMFLRLAMLFSVLVSTTLYQLSGAFGNDVISKTYFVTFFTFLVTTAFIYLSEKTKDVRYFLTSQIGYDILFTTVLIFYTGPFDSVYSFFYLFNIIFAAILFRGTGALLAALGSGVLYSSVTWLSAESMTNEKSFSTLTMLTSFVAIALLAGQLVEELRKSRQRISRLERLSEEIVDSLDSGLLATDSGGVVRKLNRTAQNLMGSDQKLIGRKLESIFPDLKDVDSSQVREIEIQGKKRRMLLNKVQLPEGHSMVLLRDLTEVLELEEKLRRQERLAGVGRLAAGLAHEIRNPIASISGSAQLLSGFSDDAEERQRLTQIIIRESERVDRLVAQLLRFAKPGGTRREKLAIDALLNDCIEALKARNDFQESGVKVDANIEAGLNVQGVKDELSEVFTNLLVNALQALGTTQNNLKKIIVKATQVGREVEIEVRDNGPGIPSEYKSRIFDPFFTTKPEGTGLGLAQVHKIIRDHDGQVDVSSEENKGTALRVRLPT